MFKKQFTVNWSCGLKCNHGNRTAVLVSSPAQAVEKAMLRVSWSLMIFICLVHGGGLILLRKTVEQLYLTSFRDGRSRQDFNSLSKASWHVSNRSPQLWQVIYSLFGVICISGHVKLIYCLCLRGWGHLLIFQGHWWGCSECEAVHQWADRGGGGEMPACDRPCAGQWLVPFTPPWHVCPLQTGHEPGTGLSGERHAAWTSHCVLELTWPLTTDRVSW